MKTSDFLEHLMDLALAAGERVYEIYRGGIAVTYKSDASPLTEADLASEGVILPGLRQLAPDVAIVSEEQDRPDVRVLPDRPFFLVDPLDGTKEFINRRDDFTVNIALIDARSPVLGVVYAPARGLMFAGDVSLGRAFVFHGEPGGRQLGKGAPLQVRAATRGSLVAVASRSHRDPDTDAFLAQQGIVDTRAVGSSLKFCLVAEGQADVYPRMGPTMEWDTAAGHAVLLAAGGDVRTLEGEPLRYGKPEARNPSFVACGQASSLTWPTRVSS